MATESSQEVQILAGAAFSYFANAKRDPGERREQLLRATGLGSYHELDTGELSDNERRALTRQLAVYAGCVLAKFSHVEAISGVYMHSGKEQPESAGRRHRDGAVFSGVFFGRMTSPIKLQPSDSEVPVHVALADNPSPYKFVGGNTTSNVNILILPDRVDVGGDTFPRNVSDLAMFEIIDRPKGSRPISHEYSVTADGLGPTNRFEFIGLRAILDSINAGQPSTSLGATAVLPTLPTVRMRSEELGGATPRRLLYEVVDNPANMALLQAQLAGEMA